MFEIDFSMASFSILAGFKLALNGIIPPGYEELLTGQDLVIKFLSAEVCFAYSKNKKKFLEIYLEFTKNGYYR